MHVPQMSELEISHREQIMLQRRRMASMLNPICRKCSGTMGDPVMRRIGVYEARCANEADETKAVQMSEQVLLSSGAVVARTGRKGREVHPYLVKCNYRELMVFAGCVSGAEIGVDDVPPCVSKDLPHYLTLQRDTDTYSVVSEHFGAVPKPQNRKGKQSTMDRNTRSALVLSGRQAMALPFVDFVTQGARSRTEGDFKCQACGWVMSVDISL